MFWIVVIVGLPLFVAVLRGRGALGYAAATLAMIGAATGGASAASLATIWLALLVIAIAT